MSLLVACRRDPLFLVRRYTLESLALAALSFVAWTFRGPWWSAPPHWVHGLAALAAVPFGWWVSALMHNTGHGNYPRRLNAVLGHFAGSWLGYGLTNFTLIHALHHAYADRTHDPVSPRGHGFVGFLLSPMGIATQRARAWLRLQHGNAAHYEWIARGEWVLFQVALLLRVTFWLGLFGPSLFVAFYVVSIISNVSILAHINFACHRDHPDGSVELVDLDEGLYYRLTNAITRGGYFHKSHHRRPGLRDPRVQPVHEAVFTVERPPGTPQRLAPRWSLEGTWGAR